VAHDSSTAARPEDYAALFKRDRMVIFRSICDSRHRPRASLELLHPARSSGPEPNGEISDGQDYRRSAPRWPSSSAHRPRLRHRQGPPVTTVPAFLSLVAALASRGLRAVALLRAKARPCASGAIRAANGLQLYASCGSRRAPFPFISARAQRCARPRSSYRGKRAACAKSQ
jgi:hypothetical protein